MSGSPTPRLATGDQFPAVVDLLERVFGYGAGGIRAHIPNWFDDDHPDRYAVIEREGRVVSTVGVVPQRFVVGGGVLDCWAVGNVATAPAHRGNGYMTSLVEFWLDELDERGVPMAELGGDRRRYNRFGWEVAGREYTYTVTDRTFEPSPVDGGAVREYRGTDRDLDLVTAVHGAEPYRLERDRAGTRALFDQEGVATLLYAGDGGDAYLAYTRESPSLRYAADGGTRVVPELGGSERGVRALLSTLWETVALEELRVRLHPTHHLNDLFRAVSAGWSMAPNRMLNLLDFAAALPAFEQQLSEKWAATPHAGAGAVTLAVEDGDGPPVAISYAPDDVTVAAAPDATPDVSLSRLEMTQFLFGFPDVYSERRAADPLLGATLPLDFYIWRLEGP